MGVERCDMKILVVDDSKVMRMIVKRTLRQAGFGDHEVVEAADGKEGLDAAAAHKPGLILCDWNMPNMNGIEMLQNLRASGNDVPFGFVTTEATPEMRKTAYQAGALFLISKPFTADDFKKALRGVLD